MKRYYIIFLLSLLANNFLNAQADDYIPLLREGVKWVCKETKFDIEEGTPIDEREKSRFYTIEIKGDSVIDGRTYKKCYRYSDVDWSEFSSYTIHCSNTEPMALLREEGRTVYAYNKDIVYYNTVQALENFIYWSIEEWYGEEPDVKFIEFNENKYFKFVGYKPFLGKQCEVYSFDGGFGISSYELIGAFIEGVGFDSDKFGDLLTPFYNEALSMSVTYSYIGLHHMEDADGNIIYYGKAYDVEPLKGDMNHDGIIDVEDVNALINIILKLD